MALQTATIDGLEMVLKRIDKAVQFNHANMRKMRNSNRKVAQIYVRYLKRRVVSMNRDIVVKRNGRIRTVTPGTLKDSMGTWTPNKSRATVLGGPKTFNNATGDKDGWFAHFVEEGDFPLAFGGKNRSHPNYHLFEKAKKATHDKMKAKLYQELRTNFATYMK